MVGGGGGGSDVVDKFITISDMLSFLPLVSESEYTTGNSDSQTKFETVVSGGSSNTMELLVGEYLATLGLAKTPTVGYDSSTRSKYRYGYMSGYNLVYTSHPLTLSVPQTLQQMLSVFSYATVTITGTIYNQDLYEFFRYSPSSGTGQPLNQTFTLSVSNGSTTSNTTTVSEYWFTSDSPTISAGSPVAYLVPISMTISNWKLKE